MAIPPTGSLSFTNVETEFGPYGSSPGTSLSEYIRSSPGTYLGPSPFTGNIAAALPLSLSNFYGTANNNTGTPTFNNTYSTSALNQTQPIQPGTKVAIIEAWGAGGGGSGGTPGVPTPPCSPPGTCQTGCSGQPGVGGAYARRVLNLSTPYSTNWGKTVIYSVGAAGSGGSKGGGCGSAGANSNVVSGTLTLPASLQSGGGSGGVCAAIPLPAAVATGGCVNTNNPNPTAISGYSTPTLPAGAFGAGGCGGVAGLKLGLCGGPGKAGSAGAIRFVWL